MYSLHSELTIKSHFIMQYRTNYYVATHWLHNSFILCNEICEIDNSVYENCRFNFFNEEDGTEKEIYQWFLTNCSESEVEWLEEHFGLLFTYSDALDLFILCVDHYGTSWDYVSCETDIENAKAKEGDKLGL